MDRKERELREVILKMRNEAMKCMVCGSENDVKKLGNIYTIGSEGTDLCFNCRVIVGNFIKGLMKLKNDILFNYRKK